MRPIVRITVALLLLAVLVGCGSRRSRYGRVSGKIAYRGQAVNDAALLLYSAEGSQATPITIPVDEEGNFSIADVPPGEYKVVVQGAEGEASGISLKDFPPDKQEQVKALLEGQKFPHTISFPKKYKDLETTPLRCTIGDSDQPLDLELED